jgi:hypothetical protein
LRDPAAAGKDAAEIRWQTALYQFWQGQLERIEARLEPGIPKARKAVEDLPKRLDRSFWANEDEELLAVLLPLVAEDAGGGVESLAREIEARYSLTLDWTLSSADAIEWARKHAGELVKGLRRTTQRQLARTLAAWIATPGATMGELYEQLGALFAFSPRRARTIAVTEVTQAYAEGNLAGARQVEAEGLFRVIKTWHTNRDELVCPFCRPMDGQTAEGADGDEWTGVGFSVPAPPLHPGCRCWITYELVLIE